MISTNSVKKNGKTKIIINLWNTVFVTNQDQNHLQSFFREQISLQNCMLVYLHRDNLFRLLEIFLKEN